MVLHATNLPCNSQTPHRHNTFTHVIPTLPSGIRKQCRLARTNTACRATASQNPDEAEYGDSLAAAFQRELSSRADVEVGEVFDGKQLLAVLQERYGRSYDVSLVQRKYLGQNFIALNVMWKYREQQSFTLTEEEYMERLNGVAAALSAWGKATQVREEILSRKDRPRVGKAVSIMLDLDEATWREWFMA